MHNWTALVTLVAVGFYFYTGFRVGKARARFAIPAPATTGNPEFERWFRVQMNTLEWMPIFLPALWLFASYVGDIGAAVIGLFWIVGRIVYMTDYSAAASKRSRGFFIQAIAGGVLWIGALIAIVARLVAGA
jgi:glutathione S-transferase